MAQNQSTINTITMPKLTSVLNDFIVKTSNHLNKLSVDVEKRFQHFDKRINDLEVMVTLLESKLNSLPPDVTSTYPQLTTCTLDDVNPVITITQPISAPSQAPATNQQPTGSIPPVPGPVGTANPVPNPNPVPQEETTTQQEEAKDEPKELTPQEQLQEFMDKHNDNTFISLQKMLKLKIPKDAIRQKAMMNGINMDDVEELISLWQKANPY
jgi:hypothetical protein